MVDITLVENVIGPIVVFLLIWALSYALLQKSKILGAKTNIDAATAFAIAILFILIPQATSFVKVFTPWFIVFFFAIVLLFALFYFIGWDFNTIQEHLGGGVIVWAAIIIFLIILFTSLSGVLGPSVAPYEVSEEGQVTVPTTQETGTIGTEVREALFNPKLLGAIFLLLVAAFAVRLLSEATPK